MLMAFHRYRRDGASAFPFKGQSPAFWGAAALLLLAAVQSCFPAPPESLTMVGGPLTLSRDLTASYALDWAGYAALLLILPPVFRDPKAVTRLAWGILMMGATLSLVGLAQRMAGDSHYLGLRPINQLGVPFGPFPNKNHAGALLAAAFCAGAGILTELVADRRRLARERRTDELMGRFLVLSCLLFATGAGLLASRSRAALAGLILTGAFVAFLRILDRSVPSGSRMLSAALVASAAAAGTLAHLADVSLLGRLASGSINSVDFRIAMAKDALRLIGDFPFFGVGLGAFRVASPLYHDPVLGMYFVDYVHCEPLQLASEAGIPFALLFFSSMISAVALSWHRTGRGSAAGRTISRGLLCACMVVMLHQLVDFPNRIPGVQVVWIAALAAVWGLRQPSMNSRRPAPPPRRQAGFALFLFVAWLAAFGPKLAASYFDFMASRTIPPSTHYFQNAALSWRPSFERQWAMAWSYSRAAAETPAARIVLWRHALRHSRAAMDLQPYHPNLRRFHASILAALGRQADARDLLGPP
ncbi:MAG: O-antigen ligase family protein [Elusimicrobia bacterium]|nr:O-antigen ligase family protein [Elusimicrobiota bacterium]